MVHTGDSVKEFAWFRSKLGQGLTKVCEKKDGLDAQEDALWRGFDLADAMEQGLAPGTLSNYVEPHSVEGTTGEQNLIVEVEANKDVHKLLNQDGKVLLTAVPRMTREGHGYDIYMAQKGEVPGDKPAAFELRGNSSRDEWLLTSTRCERCNCRGKRQCGVRELARMIHYVESIGDGQAFCMDVELPETQEDRSLAVVCSICGDPSAELGETVLSTRRPKWNPRHRTLTLDFRGRCGVASAKNFQLEVEGDSGTSSRLLFGQVNATQYVLDYQYPLGTVQAFAASISVAHWQ